MKRNETRTEVIYGVSCNVTREKCSDGRYHDCYTFTVKGWEECSIIGKRDTKRVINARQMPSVRWAYGIKD
jgi:hypothetical protein